MTVDELAQIIRTVDGENKLGAGALAEAILAAAPSASMGRVTVKALEWREEVAGTWWCADAYRVETFDGGGWAARVADPQSRAFRTLTFGVSLERAKNTCQSHYEARILAALDSPPDHGGGEGWVMVPREPTMAMMAAGADRVDDSMAHANAVYRAMLASLPTQESEDGR